MVEDKLDSPVGCHIRINRAGGSNFIMPRPVVDEGHDFLTDSVKNYVEFKYPMYNISISKSIN